MSQRDRAMKALSLRNEIIKFLETAVADNGEINGSGGGMGSEDIHVTVGGERFHIQIHWGNK